MEINRTTNPCLTRDDTITGPSVKRQCLRNREKCLSKLVLRQMLFLSRDGFWLPVFCVIFRANNKNPVTVDCRL